MIDYKVSKMTKQRES